MNIHGLPIALAGARLDRADHVRGNPAALAVLREGPARLLRMEGLEPVIEEGALAWQGIDAAGHAELVFLGLEDGEARFAEVPEGIPISGGANWGAMAALPPHELAAWGTARSLVGWHTRHRFCAVCGAPTVLAKGGWQRSCTEASCGAEHFPRVDPVTIMLVEHEGRALLGRQPRFPEGRYSTLAGFVEPGESIEEAVARETFEEAGVRVRDVTYIASQPWPFSSSLMIGCHAVAEDDALTIDTTELEDARWFTRAEVAEAISAVERGEAGKAFGAPPRHAIAHQLMRWWLGQAG